MKIFALFLTLIAAAQASRPALLRVDPAGSNKVAGSSSSIKEFGISKRPGRKSKRSLYADLQMSMPEGEMSFPQLSIDLSIPIMSMSTVPALEEAPTIETLAPTSAPTAASTAADTSAEDTDGEETIVIPTNEPVIEQINAEDNTDGSTTSGGIPASGTILIVVVACAAATVLGALVARKMYVTSRAASSNASSASSVVSSIQQPSVAPNDMTDVPI